MSVDPSQAPSGLSPTPPTSNDVTFEVGDHVYHWCSFAGIPEMFQHHGIVIGVQQLGDETELTIVDFSAVVPNVNASSISSKRGNGDRQQGNDNVRDPPKQLQKLPLHPSVFFKESKANVKHHNVKKNEGEVPKATPTESHPVNNTMVTAQELQDYWNTKFPSPTSSSPGGFKLLSNFPDLVQAYTTSSCKWHIRWCIKPSLGNVTICVQAESLLGGGAARAKQSAAVAVVAGLLPVTVPASGLMGMLGFTTQVSLFVAQPLLLPVVGLCGLASYAVPKLVLKQTQEAWKQTTELPTQEFQNVANSNKPENFAERTTNQSNRGEEETFVAMV